MASSICAHTAAEVQRVTSFILHKKPICCKNSLKNDEIVVNGGCVDANGVSMSSEAFIIFLQIVHHWKVFQCHILAGPFLAFYH